MNDTRISETHARDTSDFASRHIGPSAADAEAMLDVLQVKSLDALMEQTIPRAIRQQRPLEFGPALSEWAALRTIRRLAAKNTLLHSMIGQGYHGTILPGVIQRNILENPAWYTAYTPYQPEISQGRLEALLNFQTMIADLTGLEIANASLLDEATAAIDSASEAAFRAALQAAVLGCGRTVLTVAHRLATAQEADRVLVLEAGQIVEEGPPDELIRRGGRFAALLELEAAGWDWQTDGRASRP